MHQYGSLKCPSEPKSHDGLIIVDSQPGRGTTFKIQFSLSPQEGHCKLESKPDIICGNGELVLVVDDGSADLEPLLRAAHPDLEVTRPGLTRASASPQQNAPAAPGGLVVRLLSLPYRASIGEKRTAAAHAARGDVILHWDDDDFHEPKRVSAQIAPIVRGDAELTAAGGVRAIRVQKSVCFFLVNLDTDPRF